MLKRLRDWADTLYQAYDGFSRNGGIHLAAGIAYFFGLSLFPLLSVAFMTFGWFLRSTNAGQDAGQMIVALVRDHTSEDVGKQVAELIKNVTLSSSTGGVWGLVVLFATAIVSFGELQQAFDRIWRIPLPTRSTIRGFLHMLLLERAVAFLMMLGAGVMILSAFLITTTTTTIQSRLEELQIVPPSFVWSFLQVFISLLVNCLAFAMIYRWLPKAKVRWSEAMTGAFLVGFGWEVGRHILAAFLVGTRYASAYGVVGAFISLMVWCYYGCILLLLGAEVVAVLGRKRGEKDDPLEAMKSLYRSAHS
jgi:membrane protein